MPSKYSTPLNLGFHISPDITIEFIKPKTDIACSESVSDEQVNEDDDYDSYFNPLVYCAITMDDEDEEPICQKDHNNQPPIIRNKIDSISKPKKIMKNTQSNENSSFVCNSADSNTSNKIKKRFLCHICQKTFGWTTDLKRHILIHTGERPFKCTLCFATFTRNFLLQKHKSKIHQCLSPNEISQLNNNVAKNIMEIKLKMRELEKAKNEDGKNEDEKQNLKD
ncbi:hypothetical protein PGB90_008506 [Kerria lacca]